jgi:hypothetical protein
MSFDDITFHLEQDDPEGRLRVCVGCNIQIAHALRDKFTKYAEEEMGLKVLSISKMMYRLFDPDSDGPGEYYFLATLEHSTEK